MCDLTHDSYSDVHKVKYHVAIHKVLAVAKIMATQPVYGTK